MQTDKPIKAFDIKNPLVGYALYTSIEYIFVLPGDELQGDELCHGLYYVSIVQ